jgi:hypothetical protein
METQENSIERVFFVQNEQASEYLDMLSEHGAQYVLDYLVNATHYIGEHETASQLSHGTSDHVFHSKGYVLSYNKSLGYIGLDYICQQAASFDRFDICYAYKALEMDYNVSGILDGRKKQVAGQLVKLGFNAGAAFNGYESLSDNGKAIYANYVLRHSLPIE